MKDTKAINALALVINEAMKCKQTPAGIALAIISSQAWNALARQCSGQVLLDSVWGESTRAVPLSVQERGLISEEINDDATPEARLRQLCRVLLADSGFRRNEVHRLRVQVAEVKASRARYRTAWRVARARARAALGDPEPAHEVPPEPNACARCDIPRRLHGRRYTEQGGHTWVRPSDEQVLARTKARDADRRGGVGRG
ncbi:hypothetical protein [Streptomyces paromomycinus]|uniref:Uncharacterized protein n=1 Tax=Streptomyces paromomycinus TaxID=92743 RepID=A0A401W9X9_STREY|nr:hypothetical protein [Streptomyces paromomycinus]GCD46156.1 hypothetical protein GKJPGBOP_05903 [Streptomyces paromomycinus]